MHNIGRIGIVFIALIVIVPSLVGAASPEDDPVVVTVNGEAVHSSDVRFAMQSIAARMQQQGVQPESSQLMQAATKEVVETRLLIQEARRLEIKSNPARVSEQIAGIERQAGGREALTAELERFGMSYDRFEGVIAESELIQTLINQQILPGVSVSEQEIADFYTSNQDKFATPEQVHARHILFKTEEGMSDEQRAAAKTKAEQARTRALAGEDFAALARELSEGPSGPQGGDLGFFGAEQMVEPFSKAAFAAPAGGISEVVETRFGYHVIKVEERREAGSRSLAEVSPQLKEYLNRQKIATEVGTLIEKLRQGAAIVPTELPQQTP